MNKPQIQSYILITGISICCIFSYPVFITKNGKLKCTISDLSVFKNPIDPQNTN